MPGSIESEANESGRRDRMSRANQHPQSTDNVENCENWKEKPQSGENIGFQSRCGCQQRQTLASQRFIHHTPLPYLVFN